MAHRHRRRIHIEASDSESERHPTCGLDLFPTVVSFGDRFFRGFAQRTETGSMPPYAGKMSDQEVADVVSYIRNAWGNAAPAVTAAEVEKARK